MNIEKKVKSGAGCVVDESTKGDPSSALRNGTTEEDAVRTSCTIVMACDEDYAMPLATALRSLVDNNRSGSPVEIYIMCTQFSPEMRDKVERSLPGGAATLVWLNVDLERFVQFSTLPHISKVTFARLLLPYCLPDNRKRVLYLDADIIVLGDLSLLWDIDLEGKTLGAVLDSHSEENARRLGLIGDMGIPIEYFSAGVLLIDLAKWVEERVSEKAVGFLIDHPESRLADQDALNIACQGQWRKLDATWNCLHHPPTGFCRARPEERPGIIHYAGRGKPWLPASLSVDDEFYDSFRSCTQFARTPVERAGAQAERWWSRLKAVSRRYGITPVVRRLLGGAQLRNS